MDDPIELQSTQSHRVFTNRSDDEATAIRSRNAGIGLGVITEQSDNSRWGAWYGIDPAYPDEDNTVLFDGTRPFVWAYWATEDNATEWIRIWVETGEDAR